MKRILIRMLIIAVLALTAGCQTIAGRFNSPELPEKGRKSRTGATDDLYTKQQLFINAAVAAQNSPKNHDLLMDYFETGVMLSDDICNTWFATHFKADREANHTKSLTNIVGSTAIGVLGFTGAEAKQLGIFGLGMAGLNAEFENYMAYYLLSPAIPQIRKKINEGREGYADRIRTSFRATSGLTFPVVQRALAGYHELCSRIEIQRIVTESVELAQYKVPDLKAAEKRNQITAGEQGLHEILTNGEPGSLSADEVTALYVADKARSNPPADDTKLKARYTENPLYKSWIDKLTAIRTDKSEANKAKNAKLSQTLQEAGELVGGREAWNDVLGGTETKKPDAAEKPAQDPGPLAVERAIIEKPQVTSAGRGAES